MYVYKVIFLFGMCDFIYILVGVFIKYMECDYKIIDLIILGMICLMLILF